MYYMTKKVESGKAKIIDEPEEQHVSSIQSGRGKGFMCYGDQVVNVPNKLKKDVVPRKTRSQTTVDETVVGDLANSFSIQKPHTQQRRRSQLTIDGQLDDTVANTYAEQTEENTNETDDVDDSDMDLSDDNPQGDDDAARYGVFMHNKSTATPNSTYLGLMVTSSSLDFIQTLLYKTPANELMDFISHPVYIDSQTTSVVHNPEGNPELTSYISGASEVPLGTYIDVLATKTLLQEISLQAKAKKLMKMAKKNMRKTNFKKAVAQKFREYDQKLEALINFNVSKAFEKAVQARFLTEIKKLLPTHIPKAVANYVRPRLNTSVLDVMKNNQINIFTQSSTSTNDLSEMDLNLKLLNRIYENKSNTTHPTNQKLYDTLYESVCLDHDALNSQDAEQSFHKRSHDNQDSPNNHEGEN
ncbi:hypothetical protein Tco_0964153 [Tanacetum coccineum]